MTSTRPTPSARRPLRRKEKILMLTLTVLNTSSPWNKIAGPASAGLLRLKNGTLPDADR